MTSRIDGMGEVDLGVCQRRPPPTWPGERCTAPARYEIRYFIAIAPEPRLIHVCDEHLIEMFKAQELGAIREMEILEMTGAATQAG